MTTALSSHLLVCNSSSAGSSQAAATASLSYIASPLSSPSKHSSLSSSFISSANIWPQKKNVLGMKRPFCPRAAVVLDQSTKTQKERQQMPKKKGIYDIRTFTVWLLKQEQSGVIDGELIVVLSSIASACKQIASLVQRAGISNLTGLHGAVNVQGEDQKKLDVVSNEVFCGCLRSSGRTGIIASEEEDVPVAVEESYSGNYVVVFDPLDGSSNLDAAVSTGSIFGIYNPNDEWIFDSDDDNELGQVKQRCIVNVCQPGSNLLAAGYCMYSSSVILVLSVGKGVYGFTLDPMYGEFVLTHVDIKIPKKGSIYSFNEGNYQLWDDKLKRYMDDLKNPSLQPSGKPYSGRYIGSLVGDFHRTLLYGGIYGYPSHKESANGKLRLLYECAPMSYLAEQAGGKGSDGHERVLDIHPQEVHQRIPLYVGSVEEVEKLENYLS